MERPPPNNVRHLPITADAASDRAIEWVARLRAADVTPADQAEFALWLNASPANAQAFDEATALWHITGIAELEVPTAVRTKRAHSRWVNLAAAASVLVIALGSVIQLTPQQFATGKGEQRRVVLEDGSVAFLNTQSRIAVSYRADARAIELIEGEVWFNVESNAARPFVVTGDFASARAVGTAFAVREADQATFVGVSEGLVAVQPTSGQASIGLLPIQLAAGEGSTVDANGIQSLDFDPDVALAWRRGQLIYENITLAALLADLNRYLPATMTLNDDALAQLEVSAVLFIDDQQAMLEALATTLPLKWTRVTDDLIILTKI